MKLIFENEIILGNWYLALVIDIGLVIENGNMIREMNWEYEMEYEPLNKKPRPMNIDLKATNDNPKTNPITNPYK